MLINTRDHTTLYIKVWGSGRPVILVHGWPLSADSWDDQAMAIANAGMQAIAYDRRGFGRSSHAWDGYDYDSLTDDLAAVIEATSARDATLVGFSMGGGEVARYMSRYEGRQVVQACLVSAVVPCMLKSTDNPHGVDQRVFDEMTAAMTEDRAHFFADFFETFFGTAVMRRPISDEIIDWARSMAMMASLKATLACAHAFAATDFRDDMAAMTVPTLVIHGTADKTVPIEATGHVAAATIPNATLIEYEGAPHGVFATNKQQLTRDLLTFVRS